MKHIIVLFLVLAFTIGFGQTNEERREIAANYDMKYLDQLFLESSEYYIREKKKAFDYAIRNDIPTFIEYDNGEVAYLQQVLSDGTLLYYRTDNENSAQTINTNNVRNGGDRNLSLDGSGIILGIWDGGQVRLTHQEFNNRAVQLDNATTLSGHATHVAGTMIASGVNTQAKGMAPTANLRAYSFNNDFSEMVSEASNGLLISNHSYGLVADNLSDSFFGAYVSQSRNIDILTSSTPYYLPVFSAGNDRNHNPPHNPTKNGYDLLNGNKIAKNNLCVANVLAVPNYTGPSSVIANNSTSYGPADDGRIKPDIAAQGTSVFSSLSGTDSSYGTLSGTSMAAPAVSGSLALLQQHHNNMFGNYLTAASLKALVLHTAKEAGNFPGPDYRFGWGLMDTAAASDMITNNGFTSNFEENTLNQGETYSFTIETIDSTVPLKATIAWTDPAGEIQDTTTADDPTPRLVNDLDIRIIDENGTVYFPWKLNPALPTAAATKGDNMVDNIEKIEIDNPTGIYTIEISHKGFLQNGSQNYSLVVSGIKEASDLHVAELELTGTFCEDESNAVYNLIVNSLPNFSGTINLTQTGLPSSLSVNFSPSSITDSGATELQISNLTSVPVGDYPFTINATSGSSNGTLDLVLRIGSNALNSPNLIGPSDNETGIQLSPVLEWQEIVSTETYEVEISENSDFSSIIQSGQTSETFYEVEELEVDTDYFWRARALNDCSTSSFSSSSFKTKTTTCAPLFVSTDTPLVIPGFNSGSVESIITIPDAFSSNIIDDLNVNLEINHTSIGDLLVSLTSPNGTTITLLDNYCHGLEGVDATIDDKGSNLVCSSTSPTIDGTVKGVEKLSNLSGENFVGDWILSVEDFGFNLAGGTLENFEIQICYSQNLSLNSSSLDLFTMYPNPANNIVNIALANIAESQSLEIYDLSGRLVRTTSLEASTNTQQIAIDQLSQGIYLVKVIQDGNSFVEKLIVN